MITTNNKRIYEKLLLLRTHGITKERKNLKIKSLLLIKREIKIYGIMKC